MKDIPGVIRAIAHVDVSQAANVYERETLFVFVSPICTYKYKTIYN